MYLYLLLFVLFLIQEPVSTSAILLEAYQNGYNLWVIHILFIVATLLDIAVGYWLGQIFYNRSENTKLTIRIKRWAQEISTATGKYGDFLFYFLWGPYIFPVSTLIAPWLELPLWKTLLFLFIGDAIFWYGSEWVIVLGIKSAIPDPLGALYGVVFISLLAALIIRYLRRRD